MTNYYLRDSEFELTVNELEVFLNERGIKIQAAGPLFIVIGKRRAVIKDSETGSLLGDLPRNLQHERLAVDES